MEVLKEVCNKARKDVKEIETTIRSLMGYAAFHGEQSFPYQHTEMKANIMLTVRHLEDARMRIGKILQYADDGVSILDK